MHGYLYLLSRISNLTILVVLGGIFCKISSTLQSYIIWLISALLEVEALIILISGQEMTWVITRL